MPLPLALHLQSLQCRTAEPGDQKRVPELCSCPIVFLVCFLCRFQCPQLPEYLKLVFKVPTFGDTLASVCLHPSTSSRLPLPPCSLSLAFIPPLPAFSLLSVPSCAHLASSSVISPTLSPCLCHLWSPSDPSVSLLLLFPCLSLYLPLHLCFFLSLLLCHSAIVSALHDHSAHTLGARGDRVTKSPGVTGINEGWGFISDRCGKSPASSLSCCRHIPELAAPSSWEEASCSS